MGRTSSQRNKCQNAASYLSVGLLLLAVGLTSASASAAELIDRLLAEVNGEAILLSEVQEKVTKGPLVVVSAFPATENEGEFQVALQDAVNFRLVRQRAEELEIEIDDDRLDEEIDRFITRRNLTKAQLMDALSQQGMTFDRYREDFRDQMLLNQFQGREILPSVKITDKDIELLYLNQSGGNGENVKLTMRQLFVSMASDAGKAIADGKKALLKRIQQELEGGMEFEKAVKIYSDQESSRDNGGLMPPLLLKDMRSDLRSAIKGLNEGEFSEPVKAGNGYYIFYVEKKEFAGNNEFEKLKPQLEGQIRQQEVMRQTVQWLEDQRRRSEIRIIKE